MASQQVPIRQSSFAAGELSPRALGRVDSRAYNMGLARCRDWIINPQGSIQRRPGFKHIGAAKVLAPVVFTERANPKNFNLFGIDWADEISLWCAVGVEDGTDAYIVTSPDGITWTERANPLNKQLLSVVWSGSLFVAVGIIDGTDAYIVTSPDGATWTERTNPKNFNLHTITWNGSLFVAAGVADGTDAYIVTSPDGITWTERTNPKNFDLNSVTWNGSLFVAVGAADGTDAYIVTSTDGISWTERANPKDFILTSVTWNGSLFVAVGAADGTDAYIVTSSDSVTWTERSNPKNFNLRGVVWSSKQFVAVGLADGTDAYIVTSPDGTTWTEQVNPKNFGLTAIATNGTLLVAVGLVDGTDAYLVTSPIDTALRGLISFAGSTGKPYMIEIGHLYMRFLRDEAAVQSSPGTPLEIVTPWNANDLATLQYAQANDVMYLVHPSYTPRKLTRTGEASFTLVDMLDTSSEAAYLLKDGPYLNENTTTTTITPSAVTGSITLTASSAIFASGDVGRAVRLFEDPEWGWMIITAFTSTTAVTAFVMENDLADTSATDRWALGSFSITTGYPSGISFYQQRLSFGGTDVEPQGVWLSVQFSFEVFSPTQFDDIVVADNGIALTIASRRMSRVRWLVGARQLIAGMKTGPVAIEGTDESAQITPMTTGARLISEYDCAAVLPAVVGAVVVYAQSGGLRIRGIDPAPSGLYDQPDLTLLADHVTQTGVTEMVYAAVPSSILWAIRADGKLIGLTIHHEAESAGWHLHTMGGTLTGATEPKVLSIAVLPSEGFDQLYVIVRRTINGVDVEHIEAMQLPFDDTLTGVDLEDAWHLDAALKYDGASTTAITGLDHLEGETVKVFADGVMQADKTVSSGAITIATAASVVLVGYAFDSDLQTVPLRFNELPGAYVRPWASVLEVLETSGLQIGRDTSNLKDVVLVTGLNTGDIEQTFESPSASTITRPQYVIRSKDALPASLLSLTHRLEVEGRP